MNRKILSAVIMTSLIVSAFAGCGSTDSSDSTETSAAETSAAETEAASESEESEAETSETESDSEAETEASSDDFGVWTALAGDFTYFLFRDDTMETTYHTEFRYGDDLDELQKYLEGKYAY